jgi:hypothetical protein
VGFEAIVIEAKDAGDVDVVAEWLIELH